MQNLRGSYLKKLAHECVQDYVVNERPPRTITNLKNFLGRFLLWLEDRELTVKECKRYIKYMQQDRGMEWSSVSSDTRRLKMFLKWLRFEANEEEGVIPEDWARDIKSPRRYGDKNKKPPRLPRPEELLKWVLQVTEPGPNDHKLHRIVKQEHREFLIFFMKAGGLRPGEAMNINPDDVHLDDDYPHVVVWRGKNNKWQPIGLGLDYLEPVRKRVEQGRWFEVNETRLEKYMKDISKLAGYKVVLYTIRKSMDTYALDADAPIMKLAIHQGHTVATMQKYYALFSAKQSSEVNNTYNPQVDRTKLPIDFMLPRVQNLAKELERHPGFKVVPGERSLLIEW